MNPHVTPTTLTPQQEALLIQRFNYLLSEPHRYASALLTWHAMVKHLYRQESRDIVSFLLPVYDDAIDDIGSLLDVPCQVKHPDL